MREARMSRPAIRDLDQIWMYIAADNVEAAERLIAKVQTTARLLARFPGMGRRRDELKPGMLSFPLGNYVIFYRRHKRGIEVLHVYHGARNFEDLF